MNKSTTPTLKIFPYDIKSDSHSTKKMQDFALFHVHEILFIGKILCPLKTFLPTPPFFRKNGKYKYYNNIIFNPHT